MPTDPTAVARWRTNRRAKPASTEPHLCRGCRTVQPRDQFGPSADINGGWTCRPCASKKAAMWARKNPDKIRATFRRHFLRKTYGLSEQAWQTMYEQQQGQCAICGRSDSAADGRRLAVDHDHQTGAVRALLCSRCNLGIGYFNEDTELLQAVVGYLARWAAVKEA